MNVDLKDCDEVAAWLRVSAKTVRRWVASGHCPKPVRVGEKLLRWRTSDLQEWLDNDCLGGWEDGPDEED